MRLLYLTQAAPLQSGIRRPNAFSALRRIEALGQSLDLIIPEKQRKIHWSGYHKTMQTGQTRCATDVLRVPAIDKEGRRLSIAFTVALLYSAEKKLTGIVVVVRDETTRLNEERSFRKRLAELESAMG